LILLWGLRTDEPMAEVHLALQGLGAEVVFVDQTDYSRFEFRLEVGESLSGRAVAGGRSWELDEIGAAYARPYELNPGWDGRRRLKGARLRAFQTETAIVSWSEVTDALVVNRPSAMTSNNSKPFQLELVRAAGFRVPETLVTTSPEEALKFWEEHGEVVYKSISGTRSVVSRLREAHRERLKDVSTCPTQFQEYIAGVDYRVHVVRDSVIATRVRSGADDYRYAGSQGLEVQGEAASVPADVEERCVALTKRLGLAFAGLDLRLDSSGEWYCFEANPSPAFSFFQALSGQRIDEAVARLLVAGS
jgi:glutathione synthase/RimK-type ligase-like ATP-grasp enzyme